MRDQLLEFIRGLNLTGFTVSKDLPYTSSNEALYIKNVKRIYVDNPQLTIEPFISVMQSLNIDSEVTTISVYFTTDAKQQPTNYSNAVSSIRAIKEDFAGQFFRRECSVNTELQADLQVTQLEFRFTKLI